MTFYVTNQNYVVLWLFVIGIVIGVIYDIFKVKHEVFGAKLISYIIDDIVFSIIYTIIFVFTIFLTNYGYVRWYEIASALIGFFLYKSTLSKVIVKISVVIVGFILKVIKTMFVVLAKPIVHILSLVLKFIKRIYILLLLKYETKKAVKNSKKKLKRLIILSGKGFHKT